MKINIENGLRQLCPSEQGKWLAEKLVADLKELRDRTQKGDKAALDEFFTLYCFDENRK